MIRSVVEGHGGAIREVGREKRGAIFEMFLPIADPASTAESTADQTDLMDAPDLPDLIDATDLTDLTKLVEAGG